MHFNKLHSNVALLYLRESIWNIVTVQVWRCLTCGVSLFPPARVPPFVLLHGTSDIVVPVESSTRFSELLTSLAVKVSLYLLPKVDHTDIVTDLMVWDRRFYHTVYSCIKQEHRKLMGACWSLLKTLTSPKQSNWYYFMMCRTLVIPLN